MHAHRRLVPPRRAPPAPPQERHPDLWPRLPVETAPRYRPPAAKPLYAGRPAWPGSDRHRWRPAPADAETGPGGYRPHDSRPATVPPLPPPALRMAHARPPVTPQAQASRIALARRPPRRGLVSLGRTPLGGPLATSPAIGELAAARSPPLAPPDRTPRSDTACIADFHLYGATAGELPDPAECPRQGSRPSGLSPVVPDRSDACALRGHQSAAATRRQSALAPPAGS